MNDAGLQGEQRVWISWIPVSDRRRTPVTDKLTVSSPALNTPVGDLDGETRVGMSIHWEAAAVGAQNICEATSKEAVPSSDAMLSADQSHYDERATDEIQQCY